MEKELIKKNAYDRIIYDTEYPSYTSSYCKMMRDYTEKYGVIDDRELVEAVFLYRGYIIENISEDIKKDKEFLINMFELYPFLKKY